MCLQSARAQDTTLSSVMTGAADAFLHTLSAGERKEALLNFNDPVRLQWSNEPENMHPRKGLRLDEMTVAQKEALHRLLQTALSEQGYLKVLNVIRLDEWLKHHYYKPPEAQYYGEGLYWITLFGKPDRSGRWGWRFEGHHLSLNITVSPGVVNATPFFLGTHPGVIPAGPLAGAENLFAETQLGWKLLESLTPAERRRAILSNQEPKGADIVIRTGKEPEVKAVTGIPVRSLDHAQQQIIKQLIGCYVNNLTPVLARHYQNIIRQKAWADLHFTWMGPVQPGQPAYYRIASKEGLIIEYCSRLHDVHHIHTLWRWRPGDFGGR
jgi:hypothetical protein